MTIDYTPALLLDDEWQWGQTLSTKIKQWVLGWVNKPDVVYASVIWASGPSGMYNYRIIVRDKNGLISLDDRADELEVAMLAAETHILFIKEELCGTSKHLT
jgi:hypothetical protein